MEREKWLLTITYDSYNEQFERDPELEFPNDEVSQVLGQILEWSGCLVEDLQDFVEFTETSIKTTFDSLQNIEKLMDFILMDTVPLTLVLTREAE